MNWEGENEQVFLSSGHAFRCRKMKKKNQVHSGSSQALEGGQHMSEHFAVMKT